MIDAEELKWLGEPLHVATYRQGANGHSAAQVGLTAALARGARASASITRTMPTARIAAPARPNASTNKPRDRVQIVADAVQRDPALKGKAAVALYMLADSDIAGLSGEAIVKALKAGATASPPSMAITTPAKATTKRTDAMGGGMKPTAESSAAWDRVYDRMFGRKS